jgi:hypothetical protein
MKHEAMIWHDNSSNNASLAKRGHYPQHALHVAKLLKQQPLSSGHRKTTVRKSAGRCTTLNPKNGLKNCQHFLPFKT